MDLVFSPQALKDRDYWKQTGNTRIMKRISALLADVMQHPFSGIGKPEPLKGELHGLWSRRITAEHRLIYSVSDGMITVYVLSMRFHYSKRCSI